MVAPGINCLYLQTAEFSFNNYLRNDQQTVFQTLDSRLKDIITSQLLQFGGTQDLQKVRYTLDIVASCQEDTGLRGAVVKSFFSKTRARNYRNDQSRTKKPEKSD